MVELRTAHTADLDAATLAQARRLLEAVFEGDFSDDDWDHTCGGMHVLLRDDGELIAHAAVVGRRLLHDGRALRTGYVEGVGVRADRRRRGHGALLMQAAERMIRGGYVLGALGATEEAAPLYAVRGWRRWTGPTSVLTPSGVEPTPEEDGWIYVLPVTAAIDVTGALTCDWRDGDPW